MRTSKQVETALHCCLVLAWAEDRPIPSARLAELFDLPPAYLNKAMQALAHSQIVESVAGAAGGFRLVRPPAAITLMDVVAAIEGRDPLFRCDEIRQHGTAASAQAPTRACGIARAMGRADAAYRRELAAQTIASLMDDAPTAVRRRTLAALRT
jgi:Rrf2 family protein